jgi:hypothetical protein
MGAAVAGAHRAAFAVARRHDRPRRGDVHGEGRRRHPKRDTLEQLNQYLVTLNVKY